MEMGMWRREREDRMASETRNSGELMKTHYGHGDVSITSPGFTQATAATITTSCQL
jgi:hypothetical protein